ncbi:hypothetical protein BC936DRAFT_147766 [Jimgerdemannia flammicorona]|uniref:Uncharacterized protein n=1 Tax=Jimgerdemannia flammicorona TaxID=994334 RepID=A0A433D4J7_9FUNG|nr:hypothetical protein BC936DRAFT_147766 [Jimgerdemannia flammicorona]
MSGTISYVSLLAQSLGPGVILCPSCPKLSLYFVSAFTTCIFILLHIVWMMLAFEGFSASSAVSRAFQTSWVILTHLAASYAVSYRSSPLSFLTLRQTSNPSFHQTTQTLLNASVIINLGCLYSIIACLGLLGVSSVLVIRSLMRLYKSSGSESASNAGGAGGL